MTDSENLKSYREISATRNALTSQELTLVHWFVLFRVFRGSFLGCMRTIQEMHEIHEITRRVFPNRFPFLLTVWGRYYQPKIGLKRQAQVFLKAPQLDFCN